MDGSSLDSVVDVDFASSVDVVAGEAVSVVCLSSVFDG